MKEFEQFRFVILRICLRTLLLVVAVTGATADAEGDDHTDKDRRRDRCSDRDRASAIGAEIPQQIAAFGVQFT